MNKTVKFKWMIGQCLFHNNVVTRKSSHLLLTTFYKKMLCRNELDCCKVLNKRTKVTKQLCSHLCVLWKYFQIFIFMIFGQLVYINSRIIIIHYIEPFRVSRDYRNNSTIIWLTISIFSEIVPYTFPKKDRLV